MNVIVRSLEKNSCNNEHLRIIIFFGFTGTPTCNQCIFGWSSRFENNRATFERITYHTIVDAIAIQCLPFKVDYISTVREAEDIEDEKVSDIDREAILSSPERLSNIVKYIRDHFDQKQNEILFTK